MAVDKILHLLSCIFYALISVISLFIIGPIGSSMTKHKGECLLYAKTSAGYGLNSTCNFCIAMAVMFCMMYGLALAVVNVLVLLGKMVQPFEGRKYVVLTIVEAVILVLIFITACILSVGFKTLCDSLMENYDGECSIMQIKIPKETHLDTTFYTTLTVAQAGGWITFFIWLAKLVLNVFVLRAQDTLRLPCLPQAKKPKQEPEPEKY